MIALQKYCKAHPDELVLYFHSKGARYRDDHPVRDKIFLLVQL